jgi:2-isopropylmalate synthase
MKPEVEIYDTTLRDGSQGEGINFSVADKLRIAEKLDAFGVHYIEGGWPGSNPKDMEFFAQAARRKWKHALLAAFSMTRRKGVAVENDEPCACCSKPKRPLSPSSAKPGSCMSPKSLAPRPTKTWR